MRIQFVNICIDSNLVVEIQGVVEIAIRAILGHWLPATRQVWQVWQVYESIWYFVNLGGLYRGLIFCVKNHHSLHFAKKKNI